MCANKTQDESKVSTTIVNIEGLDFELKESKRVKYYIPTVCNKDIRTEIDAKMTEIDTVLDRISELFPDSRLKQRVVFCEPRFYTTRFIGKSSREDFDPAPWVEWSEGDIDLLEDSGARVKAFFIKLGASFSCDADKERFYGHELIHPFMAELSLLLTTVDKTKDEYLILDIEGLPEADERLGLMLQTNPQMTESTVFIANLQSTSATKPVEILADGYDHGSFEAVTVSKNPGYALCFLWMYEMTAEIAENMGFGGDVRERYLFGRELILNSYKEATAIEDYKRILKAKTGFVYDEKANNPDYFTEAQKRFKQDFQVAIL